MTLLFSPRRIFLARSWQSGLADQLRADGHQVTDAATGSRADGEDLRAADTVILSPPLLPQGHFAAGAAWAARKLLLVVADYRTVIPHCAREPFTAALAPTDEALRDLLRRWDPVSKTFRPRPGTVVRYRHRLTGEVRELRQRHHAIETDAIDLIDVMGRIETVAEGRGLALWERLPEGSA